MTLYDELVAAGIPVSNHESDLYFKATPEALNLLKKYPTELSNAVSFINQAAPHKGERWIDVPFAFTPWWEARRKSK